MTNSYTDDLLAGVAENQIDAEFSAREKCEALGYKSYCKDENLKCAPYFETGKFTCISKSGYTG